MIQYLLQTNTLTDSPTPVLESLALQAISGLKKRACAHSIYTCYLAPCQKHWAWLFSQFSWFVPLPRKYDILRVYLRQLLGKCQVHLRNVSCNSHAHLRQISDIFDTYQSSGVWRPHLAHTSLHYKCWRWERNLWPCLAV